MRVVLGRGTSGDPYEAYLGDGPRVGSARPWVMANMVASVDGATAAMGESRELSGDADRRVFHHLRAHADAVMATAGTVRADRYGPARPDPEVRAARVARGQREVPPIVVVSRSLKLDLDSPLFREAQVPTIVAAPADADPERLARAAAAGEVIARGAGSTDLAAVLTALGEQGIGVVLCEGGPKLIEQLATRGLLDELFLTISPRLVGGESARLVSGPELVPPVPLRLAAVAEDQGFVFLRYLFG